MARFPVNVRSGPLSVIVTISATDLLSRLRSVT